MMILSAAPSVIRAGYIVRSMMRKGRISSARTVAGGASSIGHCRRRVEGIAEGVMGSKVLAQGHSPWDASITSRELVPVYVAGVLKATTPLTELHRGGRSGYTLRLYFRHQNLKGL